MQTPNTTLQACTRRRHFFVNGSIQKHKGRRVLARCETSESRVELNVWPRYYNGNGVERDVGKALRLMHLAAKQGHPGSLEVLASLRG